MRSIVQSSLLIASLWLTSIPAAQAQKGFFAPIKEAGKSQQTTASQNWSGTYAIQIEALRSYLAGAPDLQNIKNAQGIALDIPISDDRTETFVMYESQVMAPEIAQRMPEIKTYSGRSLTSGYQIKLTLSPQGFNALLLDAKGNALVYEKAAVASEQTVYRSYRSKDIATHPDSRSCGNVPQVPRTLNGIDPLELLGTGQTAAAKFSNGGSLKRYKLAIGATGEFTNTFGGGNPTVAYAAVVAYINEVNAVFEQELGVTFQLVTDASYVFPNAATDPYSDGSNVNTTMTENQTLMDGVLGAANYDIGHAFSGTTSSSGGGVAYTGVLCWPGYKAGGASDIGDETNYHRVFSIQLIAHELGHMFNMSHSYNSNIPVCTTRELSTSVEPGSGATVMSYGFTCGSDDYYTEYDGSGRKVGPFLNFHVKSIEQALTYMANYGTCFTPVAGTNSVPVVDPMPTSYTIPKATPFTLSGTATDADNHLLSYSWEGTDVSDEPVAANLTNAILTDPAHPPFFRSYPPVATGTRTYPLMSAILNGTNTARGDKLPSVAFTTHHTLTVRDGHGGVATEDVVVTIDGSGPFLITNDPSGSYPGGSNMAVTWSVNGTNAVPVSCTLVDILLSLDGGTTFPTTVATAVPNTGSYTITLPNTPTIQARLKVAPAASTASGNVPNIFFDISNENFSIGAPLPFSLLSFEAMVTGSDAATLLWETAQDDHSIGFEIEMSKDGSRFSKLGYEPVKGNMQLRRSYQYLVNELATGKYFFRLKQLGNDGSHAYSLVRNVTIDGNRKVAIFPNPAQDHLTIEGIGIGSSIIISDAQGKVVKDFIVTNVSAQIDVKHWAAGIYFITVTDAAGNSNLYKVMKAE